MDIYFVVYSFTVQIRIDWLIRLHIWGINYIDHSLQGHSYIEYTTAAPQEYPKYSGLNGLNYYGLLA